MTTITCPVCKHTQAVPESAISVACGQCARAFRILEIIDQLTRRQS